MKISWSVLNMISRWSAHCDWLLLSNLSLCQSGCGSMYFQPSSNELLFFFFCLFVNIVDFAQIQRLWHLNFRPFFCEIVTRQEWACSRSLPECPFSSLSSCIFCSVFRRMKEGLRCCHYCFIHAFNQSWCSFLGFFCFIYCMQNRMHASILHVYIYKHT